MVLLVARHVVGTRHAPGRIDLPGAWIDKLSPLLWMVSPYSRSCLLFSLLVYSEGGRISFVLQWELQILSLMFRCVTCGFAAPGVLTGSG